MSRISTLHLSRLGFGGAPIAHLYNEVSDEQAIATIRTALDLGIHFFDTAPLYGAGLSERRYHMALRDVPRDRYVLATKVGRIVQPDGSVVFDWTRDGILRSLEDSMRRLDLERIDIVHLHDPDAAEREALEVAFPTLAELRDQGVIRAIGAGMNQWQMLDRFARSADFDCFLLAGRYTLLEQESLAFLEHCRSKGIGVFLGGVYNSGILATGAQPGAKYNYADAPPQILARVQQIEEICARHNVPLHIAALHFASAHPAVTSLIVGAASPAEVHANVAALQHAVPRELWADLRSANLIHADAPVPA